MILTLPVCPASHAFPVFAEKHHKLIEFGTMLNDQGPWYYFLYSNGWRGITLYVQFIVFKDLSPEEIAEFVRKRI